MTVRCAVPEDSEAIRAILGWYVAHSTATFSETLPDEAAFRESMREDLNRYPWYIAQEGDRLLGFAHAGSFRPQSGYRFFCELSVYLHPDAPARSGIGRALYTALLAELKRRGFTGACAVICDENESSLAFHRAFGFTESGRLVHAGYKMNRPLTAVLMTLPL